MTENIQGTDDELYGDPRTPRRRRPISTAPDADERTVGTNQTDEVEEQDSKQP